MCLLAIGGEYIHANDYLIHTQRLSAVTAGNEIIA